MSIYPWKRAITLYYPSFSIASLFWSHVALSICVSPCLHFHQDTHNTYCSLLQASLCPEGREGCELLNSKSSHKHDAASEAEPLLPAAVNGKATAHQAPLGGNEILHVTLVKDLLSRFSTGRATDLGHSLMAEMLPRKAGDPC